MATPEGLQVVRNGLIDEGRSLVVEGKPPHQIIKPGRHFYLLEFNGKKGAVRLTRSGTYRDVRAPHVRTGGFLGSSSESKHITTIQWDGEPDSSRHPAERIGLRHEDASSTMLAVGSLAGFALFLPNRMPNTDGIPCLDERPLRLRNADNERLAASEE